MNLTDLAQKAIIIGVVLIVVAFIINGNAPLLALPLLFLGIALVIFSLIIFIIRFLKRRR